MADALPQPAPTPRAGHTRWVRASHWVLTASFLTLAFTGFMILMVHPRLYWGEVGNDLTPPMLELPISRNYRHGGWEGGAAFYEGSTSPISASRTYDIFNKNGWGRSLHFLAAWLFVVPGMLYLLAGLFTRHFRRNILPRPAELTPNQVWREVKDHARLRIPASTGGPPYGLLQKSAYFAVIFLILPLTILTGLAMSPAITAAYPFISGVFGGFQSARTLHFFAFVILVLFLLVHVAMVVKSGFRSQIRGITLGRRHEN